MGNGKCKRFFKRLEGCLARIKQIVLVRHLMRTCCRPVVGKYKNEPIAPTAIGETSTVWVCWWQGEAQMPPIVKACVSSIRQHAGTHPVQIVHKGNYKDFVDMPADIVEKTERGIIDLTHFSDILRAMLLAKHGGIWMDATVFIPQKDLNDFITTDAPFWSCRHKPIYHNISRGGWTSFFFACGQGNNLARIIAEMHLAYWRTHNRLVVYLLLDYCFAIARRTCKPISRMIDATPLSAMGPLGKMLMLPYDEEQFAYQCKTFDFHKLTYKGNLATRLPGGEETVYGHILSLHGVEAS